jgi:hypothetical protein
MWVGPSCSNSPIDVFVVAFRRESCLAFPYRLLYLQRHSHNRLRVAAQPNVLLALRARSWLFSGSDTALLVCSEMLRMHRELDSPDTSTGTLHEIERISRLSPSRSRSSSAGAGLAFFSAGALVKIRHDRFYSTLSRRPPLSSMDHAVACLLACMHSPP